MQALYALNQSETPDLRKEETFLNTSIAQMYDLYLVMVDLIVELHGFAREHQDKTQQKILATAEDINPNKRFVNNPILVKISENEQLQAKLRQRKLNNWRLDSEYVNLIF
ncbi:MAG: antitermination protein NusB, partial [Leeuwenhoekiella sp.]